MQDCKRLPWVHPIKLPSCQVFLSKYLAQFRFCHTFCFCHNLGFVTIQVVTVWVLSQFESCDSFGFFTTLVLSQFEFIHYISFVTFLVLLQLNFCRNLIFVTNWVSSQSEFCHKLSFVQIRLLPHFFCYVMICGLTLFVFRHNLYLKIIY